MNSDGSKLAFIVGHYKSGSTWLSNVLSLHPGIRGLYETHAFRYVDEGLDDAARRLFEESAWGCPRDGWWKWKLAGLTRGARTLFGAAAGQSTLSAQERPTTRFDLSARAQRRLRATLELCDSKEQLCRFFFDGLLELLRPAGYLVEKTPNNIFWVPAIKNVFPQCKLIAVYRDGRDVVQSELFHLTRLNKHVGEFAQRVENWKSAMLAQLEYRASYDVLCISFEETRRNPRETLTRVLQFLGLSTGVATMEDMLNRSSFEFVTGRARGQENKNSFYRKGASGEWVRQFSEAQLREFSELAGQTLVELGYEQSPDWADWKALEFR